MCAATFPTQDVSRGMDTKQKQPTPLASHTRTVRSLDAVYKTPLPSRPPPPHLTTFTDAVCPPKVYSVRRVSVDQTLTVPSLEDDAKRGAEELLHAVVPFRSLTAERS